VEAGIELVFHGKRDLFADSQLFEGSWVFRADYLRAAPLDTHPDYTDHPVIRQTHEAGKLATTDLKGRTSYIYRWDIGTQHLSGYGIGTEEVQRRHVDLWRRRSNDVAMDGRLVAADMTLRWRQYLDGIMGQVTPIEWVHNRRGVGFSGAGIS
jgi:hypothetical protein